jgi:alpha-tubulin suppressor-like RCC1 family protein
MKKAITHFLTLFLFVFISNSAVNAQSTTGTADGNYKLMTTDSAFNSHSTGFQKVYDKLAVNNGARNVFFTTAQGYSSFTAYQQCMYDSANTVTGLPGGLTLKAEGGSICKSFTFKNINFYLYGLNATVNRRLTSFTLTVKNNLGTTIATHTLASEYTANSQTLNNLSNLNLSPAFPVGGYNSVGEVSFTFTLANSSGTTIGNANFLFKSIDLADAVPLTGAIENFEDETAATSVFTNTNIGAFNATITPSSTFKVGVLSSFGHNNSNKFIEVTPGTTGSIVSTTQKFKVNGLYLYPSTDGGNSNQTAGVNVTFTGKLGGVTKFTYTPPASDFATASYTNANNRGFTLVNFATPGHQNIIIDELVTTIAAGANYFAIDNFSFVPLQSNADLSALTISAGTLTPAFAAATTTYTASVLNATTSITVTPTRAEANATIEVRVNSGTYATVTSGSPSSALSLNVGSNTIDVKVTAQDGTTIKTYTTTVTRAAASSSTDCPYQETFEGFTTNQATSFTSNGVTFSITTLVVPTVSSGTCFFGLNTTSTLDIGWNSVTDSYINDRKVIENIRSNLATNTPGASVKISSVTPFSLRRFFLFVANGNYTVKGTNGTISILGKNGSTTVFNVSVTSSSWNSVLSGAPQNGYNTIDLATFGGQDNSFNTITEFTVTTSANSNMDYLAIDDFQFGPANPTAPTVASIAASGIGTSTATLNGTVNANGLTTTSQGFQYSLSPTLASGVTSVNASPATASGSSVTNVSANLSSLSPSTTYYYRTIVTNCHGSKYGSVLSFATNAVASTNADLSAMTLSSGTLAPSFAAATTAYTASVLNATTSITVTPTRAEANATIEVRVNSGTYATVTSGSPSSALSLNVGSNTIDVKVTAQDGTTIKTYTTTVTRAAASSSTDCPYQETFEGFTTNQATSFTSNGVTFSITTLVVPTVSSGTCFFGLNTTSTLDIGWNSVTDSYINDRKVIENIRSNLATNTPGASVKISSVTPFSLRRFFLFVANGNYTVKGTNGTISILGKNGSTTVFNVSVTSSSWNSVLSGAPQNGYNTIDLATFGGQDNSFNTITEFTVTTSANSNMDYLAIDDFQFGPANPTAPTVASIAASGIGTSTATLNGTVNANGLTTTSQGFQYSLSPTLASGVTSVNASPATASGSSVTNVSANLSSLSPSTTYYYRTIVTNCHGSKYGSVLSFATNAVASTNADLSALTLSSGTLTPSFAAATTTYTASVSNATTSITVTPTRAEANATIEVRVNSGTYATVASGSPSSALSLNVGSNTIDVKVTAQDGTTIKTYTTTVTRAAAAVACFTKISAGNAHTVGIKGDGSLWSWGNNLSGQLGNGTNTGQLSPIQIGTANNWASISAGEYYTMAIKQDGTLWAWGSNGNGQLGDATTANKTSPIQIGTATNWASVSAGSNHTLAIKTDGTLWAWGNNGNGRLGNGNSIQQTSPIQIGSDINWQSVETGDEYSVAIKTTGTLWAWGYNGSGQLGIGSNTSVNIPTQAGSATTWRSVSALGSHVVAVRTNGTLWTWGENNFGQLGDGTTLSKNVPTQIGVAVDWDIVSAGNMHSAATKTNGNLWTWGANIEGQLGNGTFTNSNVPVSITNSITNVFAGTAHTLAINTSGQLLTWGWNNDGQLGDGTTNAATSPISIACPTVLPSLLGSFEATKVNNSSLLKFTTLSEINSNYFEVQYSTDVVNFNLLEKVMAKGNATTSTHYSVTHTNPFNGLNYYRLKLVDKDGKFSFSEIRRVDFKSKSAELMVYPNPIKGNSFTVDLGVDITKPIAYILYNSIGKLVQQGNISSRQQTIHTGMLPAGSYLLRLTNGQTVTIIK